jgi:cell wall-associated NlpC family hydrolase
MFACKPIKAMLLAGALALLAVPAAHADEEVPLFLQESRSLLDRASDSIQETLDKALDLVGIRYRRGGNTPESGFDCSGFVSHVFSEGLGLYLPHSAREMSRSGEPVKLPDLKPGDLVFFNTMRRAFSHVGIYLGDNRFVHAPRAGGRVRIENMAERYWVKRFNGARRVETAS